MSGQLKQLDLFNGSSGVKHKSPLLPAYHANRDFFTADLFDVALKSDQASMEVPFFSLATKPDLSIYQWSSKDGNRHVQITPSVLGRATQMDKDVLIFLISQLMQAKNIKRVDADSRRIQFTVYHYLTATNKRTGGKEYERLEAALDRLKGTTIKTNIKANNQVFKNAFGLLNGWRIIEKSPTDARMIAVEVELSQWLFNAVCSNAVLTLSSDYFRIRQPLARRLYEIARKHCGNQATWKISFALLLEKSGSKAELKKFREMVSNISKNVDFPEYRIEIVADKDQVVFWSRDAKKVINAMVKRESSKNRLLL